MEAMGPVCSKAGSCPETPLCRAGQELPPGQVAQHTPQVFDEGTGTGRNKASSVGFMIACTMCGQGRWLCQHQGVTQHQVDLQDKTRQDSTVPASPG